MNAVPLMRWRSWLRTRGNASLRISRLMGPLAMGLLLMALPAPVQGEEEDPWSSGYYRADPERNPFRPRSDPAERYPTNDDEPPKGGWRNGRSLSDDASPRNGMTPQIWKPSARDDASGRGHRPWGVIPQEWDNGTPGHSYARESDTWSGSSRAPRRSGPDPDARSRWSGPPSEDPERWSQPEEPPPGRRARAPYDAPADRWSQEPPTREADPRMERESGRDPDRWLRLDPGADEGYRRDFGVNRRRPEPEESEGRPPPARWDGPYQREFYREENRRHGPGYDPRFAEPQARPDPEEENSRPDRRWWGRRGNESFWDETERERYWPEGR